MQKERYSAENLEHRAISWNTSGLTYHFKHLLLVIRKLNISAYWNVNISHLEIYLFGFFTFSHQ